MGRTTWLDDHGLKKGEWTSEEDRILVAYINEYGLGDWRTLPKRAGINPYLHSLLLYIYVYICHYAQIVYGQVVSVSLSKLGSKDYSFCRTEDLVLIIIFYNLVYIFLNHVRYPIIWRDLLTKIHLHSSKSFFRFLGAYCWTITNRHLGKL